MYVIYPNAVIPIAFGKLYIRSEYFFWDLIHLTQAMVGDARDDVWQM